MRLTCLCGLGLRASILKDDGETVSSGRRDAFGLFLLVLLEPDLVEVVLLRAEKTHCVGRVQMGVVVRVRGVLV